MNYRKGIEKNKFFEDSNKKGEIKNKLTKSFDALVSAHAIEVLKVPYSYIETKVCKYCDVLGRRSNKEAI